MRTRKVKYATTVFDSQWILVHNSLDAQDNPISYYCSGAIEDCGMTYLICNPEGKLECITFIPLGFVITLNPLPPEAVEVPLGKILGFS